VLYGLKQERLVWDAIEKRLNTLAPRRGGIKKRSLTAPL